jgi:hypothetical protein
MVVAHLSSVTPPTSGDRRVAWVQACDICGEGCPPQGHVWNLSGAGAYLVAEPLPDTGRTLSISFRLPDGSAFKGIARVVWRNQPSVWKECGTDASTLPAGCGLEFLSWVLSPATRSAQEDEPLAV